MDTATKVQILDKAVCFSYSTNIIWKSTHPIILPLVEQNGLFKKCRRKILISNLLNSAQNIYLVSHTVHIVVGKLYINCNGLSLSLVLSDECIKHETQGLTHHHLIGIYIIFLCVSSVFNVISAFVSYLISKLSL